jgi:hypothetical protein
MKVDITVEDYTIILNALHYYKKVEKQGFFNQYTDKHINILRDKLAHQMVWGKPPDVNVLLNQEEIT